MSYYNPTTSSGRRTADAALFTRPCILKSVILEADGTNAATITIYDNASAASGTVLAKVLIPATGTYAFWANPHGVEALNGLYADVSGTGAAYIAHYSTE